MLLVTSFSKYENLVSTLLKFNEATNKANSVNVFKKLF